MASYSQLGEGAQGARDFDDLEAPKPTRDGGLNQNNQHEYGSGDSEFVPIAEPVGGSSYSYGGDGGSGAYRAIEEYEIQVRHGFIRKVFGILSIQLGVTFGWCLLCAYNTSTKLYMQENMWPLALGTTLSIVSMIGLLCCGNAARSYPTNYALLSVFTFAESLLLGGVCAQYDADAIAVAVGTTVGVVFALVLFASQTKHDFTGCGPYLFVALSTMLLYSIVAGMFGVLPGMGYSVMGTILFSFYLVYDVQLVIGGKGRYQLSPDDYIFAALAIYLDIINLFLYILQMLNDRN